MLQAGTELMEQIVSGEAMHRWPTDARSAMRLLMNAPLPPVDRRKLSRTPYRLQADLLLTGAVEMQLTVFTRDINAWNVGFIAPIPLPPRAKAVIRLLAPDGRSFAVGCRLRRCQGFDLGWFDCVAEFAQPQYPFENL
jgi:hypothetical protein